LIDDTERYSRKRESTREILPGDGNSKGLTTTTGYLLIKNVEGNTAYRTPQYGSTPQYEEIEILRRTE